MFLGNLMAANRQNITGLVHLSSDTTRKIATFLDMNSFLSFAQTCREKRTEVLCSPHPTRLIENGTTLPPGVFTIANRVAYRLQIQFETISTKVRHLAKYLSLDNSEDLEWQIECLCGHITRETINRIIAECKESDKPLRIIAECKESDKLLFGALREKKVLFFIMLSNSTEALNHFANSLGLEKTNVSPRTQLWTYCWDEQKEGFPLDIPLRYGLHNAIKFYIQYEVIMTYGVASTIHVVSQPHVHAILNYAFKNNSMDIVDDILDELPPISPDSFGIPTIPFAIPIIIASLRQQTSFQNLLIVWKKLEEYLMRNSKAQSLDLSRLLLRLQEQAIIYLSQRDCSPVFSIFIKIIAGHDGYLSSFTLNYTAPQEIRDVANVIKNRNSAEFHRLNEELLAPEYKESYRQFIANPAITKHIATQDADRQNLQMYARKKFWNNLDRTVALLFITGIACAILFSPIGVVLSAGIATFLKLTALVGALSGFMSTLYTIEAYQDNRKETFIPKPHPIPPLESTANPSPVHSLVRIKAAENKTESKAPMPTSRPVPLTTQSSLGANTLLGNRNNSSPSPAGDERTSSTTLGQSYGS